MDNLNNSCGCNIDATKSINKTAAKSVFSLKKSTTKLWSIKKIITIAIIMIELTTLIQPTIAMAIQSSSKQRHNRDSSKSQQSLLATIKSNPNYHQPKFRKKHSVDQLEWENPCGGFYIEDTSRGSISSSSRKAAFKALRRSLKFSKVQLEGQKDPSINVQDIKSWSIHNQTYKFLQIVRPANNITLYRWHRHAQIYVASLAFFRNKQKGPDGKKSSNYQSNLTKELTDLLQSSKNVLCFIEKAINDTHIHPKINTISRNDMMLNRLKFRTIKRNSETIDEIDLKFLKVRYMEFVTGMWRALNQRIREFKYCGDNLSANSSFGSDSSYYSAASLSNTSANISTSYNSLEDKKNKEMCQKIRERRARQLARQKNNNNNNNNNQRRH